MYRSWRRVKERILFRCSKKEQEAEPKAELIEYITVAQQFESCLQPTHNGNKNGDILDKGYLVEMFQWKSKQCNLHIFL